LRKTVCTSYCHKEKAGFVTYTFLKGATASAQEKLKIMHGNLTCPMLKGVAKISRWTRQAFYEAFYITSPCHAAALPALLPLPIEAHEPGMPGCARAKTGRAAVRAANVTCC
jgi:hypothetical protein